jgi:hypothetical protein
MISLYDRLKVQAAQEGKILFVSNTNILKERMSDFDKVINIPKEEFKRRFDERGATYGFEDWKSDIDATIAKVDPSKIITTKGYLSDLMNISEAKALESADKNSGNYSTITEFYNSLTKMDRQKLGNLDDLINNYANMYSEFFTEEEYIETKRCEL